MNEQAWRMYQCWDCGVTAPFEKPYPLTPTCEHCGGIRMRQVPTNIAYDVTVELQALRGLVRDCASEIDDVLDSGSVPASDARDQLVRVSEWLKMGMKP